MCVLCYCFPGQKKEEIVGDIHVYRIKKDYFWGIEGRSRTPNCKNKLNAFLTRFQTRLKQIVYLPFFPNYEPLAIHRIKKAAINIIDSQNIDAVVADYNGIDTLMGGLYAAQKRKRKFSPIFWDSLSAGIRARYVSKKYNDKKRTNMELKVISASDVAMMLISHKDFLIEKYKNHPDILAKMCFIDIPTFSPLKVAGSKAPTACDCIKLLFLGNILGAERNPLPLLLALKKLELDIQFDCFTPNFNDSILSEYSRRFPFLKLHKPIDLSLLPEQMRESDFLVNFGVKTKGVLSSKIFTYFSSGKPVISTCLSEQEACVPYVTKYPLGFVFNDNDTPIAELKAFLLENKGETLDPTTLKTTFIENTPDFFWQKISEIIKD